MTALTNLILIKALLVCNEYVMVQKSEGCLLGRKNKQLITIETPHPCATVTGGLTCSNSPLIVTVARGRDDCYNP